MQIQIRAILLILFVLSLSDCSNDCADKAISHCGTGFIEIIKCDRTAKAEITDFEIHRIPIDYDDIPKIANNQRIHYFRNANYLCIDKQELMKNYGASQIDTLLCYYRQKDSLKAFIISLREDIVYLHGE